MSTSPETVKADLLEVFSKFKGQREELIPILQAVQERFGFLPESAMSALARFTSVAESRVYGAATFYTQFYFARRGKHTIKVCCGTACHVRGAAPLLEAFERELGIERGGTSNDFEYSLERVACVGSCALAPVVVVDEKVYAHMKAKQVKDCLADYKGKSRSNQ